jgi:hypothetical protein
LFEQEPFHYFAAVSEELMYRRQRHRSGWAAAENL